METGRFIVWGSPRPKSQALRNARPARIDEMPLRAYSFVETARVSSDHAAWCVVVEMQEAQLDRLMANDLSIDGCEELQ